MSTQIKKTLAALVALIALALGGSAIASAMNDNPAPNNQTTERADANEGPNDGDSSNAAESAESESAPEGTDDATGAGEATDPGEQANAASSAKAMAAAELATGGDAREASTEQADAPENSDPVDAGEQPTPSGAAYDVDVTKGSKDLHVYLNRQFKVLQVQADQPDLGGQSDQAETGE